MKRWHIQDIAKECGWTPVRQKKHVLEFTHMQTQESRDVNRKEGDHVKLVFKFSAKPLEDRMNLLYEAILKDSNHLICVVLLQKPSGMFTISSAGRTPRASPARGARW